jgi:long-chain acyl-CoA synthetase
MLKLLIDLVRTGGGADAIVDMHGTHSYDALWRETEEWRRRLVAANVPPGAVVSAEGDYSASCVSVLLALAMHRAVIVPISRDSSPHQDEYLDVGQVEWRANPRDGEVAQTGRVAAHALYDALRARQAPGLVLFTSGSTGKSKAAVHDVGRLSAKFAVAKRRLRTLVFLQPDHIGGINTLLYTLSNQGTIVVPERRQPAYVCEVIDRCRVELLPASPTFLKLLLFGVERNHRALDSLQLVTYGTEPMPESTLAQFREEYPHIRLQQTYGLTEVGILRSQSRPDGSLWVRVGGDGYDVQVRDGRLWVKAESAMLGYLNAPSPFNDDGYLDTGDEVVQDGEWIRILGRRGDIINVGGSKVFPAEVEDLILQMAEVEDVLVRGEANPFVGQIVSAIVKLRSGEAAAAFKPLLRRYCAERLPSYKVPARITITDEPLHGARFKKQRSGVSV